MKKVISNVFNVLMIFSVLFLVGGCKKKDKADLSKAFVKYYGGLLQDKGVEVIQTSDGGYVIAGTTNAGNGPGDILVIKTDDKGDEVWHQTIGKASVYDECGSIAILPNGDYVVVGTTALKPNREFNVNALEIGKDSTKMCAARLNSMGGVVWTKYYDNPSYPDLRIGAFGKSVVVNSNGECFLAGMVDSSYTPGGGSLIINLDVYAFIVDKNGAVLQVGGFPMIPFQYGANDQNDYTVSAIQAIDIGLGIEYIISSSTNISGINTPRVIRCRLNGPAMSQNNAPINSSWLEPTYMTGGQITKTSDFNYMLVGTRGVASNTDIFLIKLNSTTLAKMKSWRYGDLTGFKDEGISVYPTSDGGYVLMGTTNSVSYTLDAAKLEDVLVVKVDQNGLEQWHKVFGGRGNDSGSRIIQTTDGGYLICGTIAFGDDVSNSGASNSITLIKLNSDGDISNVK